MLGDMWQSPSGPGRRRAEGHQSFWVNETGDGVEQGGGTGRDAELTGVNSFKRLGGEMAHKVQ